MNVNEQNDFFESEPVKQLLAESYAAGYIFLRCNDIKFNDDSVSDSLFERDDRRFVVHLHIQRACQFIDDVVNDRFDLHTLDDNQFELLYQYFVEKHQYNTLLYRIRAYYSDAMLSRTFYVLPNYFTFRSCISYYLDDMTADEAYVKLCDVIEIAKTYTLLSKTDAHQVFYSKIKQVADERKIINELSK